MNKLQNGSMEGFIDVNGHEVISCKEYSDVGTFHEGLVSVIKETKDGDGSYDNLKLGFIDKNGEIVIPVTLPWHELEGGEPSADYEFFSDGIYEVANENRFIDKSGKTLLDYDSRWQIPLNERFSEGLVVINYGYQYGFMDKNGKVTISDAQIKKEEARRAEEEEKQRKYEEQQRQLEEQRRLEEQRSEWNQGNYPGSSSSSSDNSPYSTDDGRRAYLEVVQLQKEARLLIDKSAPYRNIMRSEVYGSYNYQMASINNREILNAAMKKLEKALEIAKNKLHDESLIKELNGQINTLNKAIYSD